MLCQVVVGSVRNAPKLAPTEGEQELKVSSSLGIEAKLLGIVVAETEIFVLETDRQQEVVAEGSPVAEPFKVGAGLAEELKLHLLKLAGTEYKVTGCDLVSEGLTDLRDTEGQLAAGCSLNVYKVCEDTLSCLGTEINGVLCVLGYALECLEHQVELTNVCEIVLSAGGTRNIVLLNEGLHLALLKSVDGLGKLKIVLLAPVLDHLVRTEALVALLAVHEGIGEAGKVT